MNLNQVKGLESLQFIPSTMTCEKIEKEKLREELDREIEAFLKRGGQVKRLANGQSAYKNNMQPLRQKAFNEEIKETPDDVIEERNKLVRAGKSSVIKEKKEHKPRPKMSVEMTDSIRSEQMKMISEFDRKMDALSRKRFCEELGITRKFYYNAKSGDSRIGVVTWERAKELMKTFPVKANPTNADDRLYELAEAKKAAIASGQVYFESTCNKHGKTKYKITSNNIPRCVECTAEGVKRRNQAKLIPEQIENAERREFNRIEMDKALSSGLKVFTGKCKKHNLCEFKITKGVKSKSSELRYQYKCSQCKLEELRKYQEKKNGSKNNA